MKIIVSCNDKYEAQKLASLIFVKDNNETFISAILNIVENELVVSLKDKSAHSVVLKDRTEVERLADFFQTVFDKKHKIVSATIFENDVEILKE